MLSIVRNYWRGKSLRLRLAALTCVVTRWFLVYSATTFTLQDDAIGIARVHRFDGGFATYGGADLGSRILKGYRYRGQPVHTEMAPTRSARDSDEEQLRRRSQEVMSRLREQLQSIIDNDDEVGALDANSMPASSFSDRDRDLDLIPEYEPNSDSNSDADFHLSRDGDRDRDYDRDLGRDTVRVNRHVVYDRELRDEEEEVLRELESEALDADELQEWLQDEFEHTEASNNENKKATEKTTIKTEPRRSTLVEMMAMSSVILMAMLLYLSAAMMQRFGTTLGAGLTVLVIFAMTMSSSAQATAMILANVKAAAGSGKSPAILIGSVLLYALMSALDVGWFFLSLLDGSATHMYTDRVHPNVKRSASLVTWHEPQPALVHFYV